MGVGWSVQAGYGTRLMSRVCLISMLASQIPEIWIQQMMLSLGRLMKSVLRFLIQTQNFFFLPTVMPNSSMSLILSGLGLGRLVYGTQPAVRSKESQLLAKLSVISCHSGVIMWFHFMNTPRLSILSQGKLFRNGLR